MEFFLKKNIGGVGVPNFRTPLPCTILNGTALINTQLIHLKYSVGGEGCNLEIYNVFFTNFPCRPPSPSKFPYNHV